MLNFLNLTMHSKFKTIMKVNSKIANENLVHTYSSNKNFLTSSVGLTLPEDNPSLIYFESITVHCIHFLSCAFAEYNEMSTRPELCKLRALNS